MEAKTRTKINRKGLIPEGAYNRNKKKRFETSFSSVDRNIVTFCIYWLSFEAS